MESVKYKVLSQGGKEVGSVDLDPVIFDAPIFEDLVHATVVWQLNKRRAGTHSVLTKGMMEGGAKKPWKQKGTGRARAGSSTSPHWVGGGVAHGPQPRDYTTRVPKRVRRQALLSVLTDKRTHENLIILDSLAVEGSKTKNFVQILKNIGFSEKQKAVVLVDREDSSLRRAGQNIPGLMTLREDGLNVYDLLNAKYLICTKEQVERIQSQINGIESLEDLSTTLEGSV